MRFGLLDKQMKQISTLLEGAGVTKGVIFGSRAKGNFRHNSDIDIAVWGDEINIGRLLTELDELPTPYKFDLVDYGKITTAAYREHIDRVGIIFFETKK
ncbi:MAG: nucleotidyltransferase domain-containing protein [Oscillospiraceae bacterium]|jgi:predicted nucleotidyltransferase|nr:nucleotidyltransferase domain-containing protein [Oscillospiraceae bacterium]